MRLETALALEISVKNMLRELRELLGSRDVAGFHMEVCASGQTLTGDLLIQYRLRERYEEWVEGGTLQGVVTETLRRKGWKAENAPICLPRVEEPEARN